MPRALPSDAAPDSPCVRNCCLDERDICLGCGRTLEEILRWHKADAAERDAIREQARQRRVSMPSR